MSETNLKPIMVYPESSQLPADHQLTEIDGKDLIDKLYNAKAAQIPVMMLTTRELQAIVEYPDVFGRDFLVIDHLIGGKYSSIWGSLTSGMKHLSADLLQSEVAAIKRDTSKLLAENHFDTVAEKMSKRSLNIVKNGAQREEDPEETEGLI